MMTERESPQARQEPLVRTVSEDASSGARGTMRAIVYDRSGPPEEVLHLHGVAIPSVKDDVVMDFTA